jgi:hypothetical protein
MGSHIEPARTLPVTECDVLVAGAGTAGVVAALAAAREGAETILVERKGYPGGAVVDAGTALHSFYNLWKAFPGVEKRQVVRGIPAEIIDRLGALGGTSGHAEMLEGYDYDSACTTVDAELYKLIAFRMLKEAGVDMWVNTRLVDAFGNGDRVDGVLTESHSAREAVAAHTFIDCTGYGDLCARAGADFSEPNDYPVANSMGLAGVDIDDYHRFLRSHDAVTEYSEGRRDGQEGQIVRVSGRTADLPEGFRQEADRIGMATVTTTVHDHYLMFVKLNFKMPVSPTDRAAAGEAELELRNRQARAG